jgi:hypothetical protein
VLYIIRIVGITDYEEMYSDVIKASSHIYGLTSIHGFRIVARPGALSSETGVDIHCVEDYSGGERWYPMPAPAHPGLGNFDAIFSILLIRTETGGQCLSEITILWKRKASGSIFATRLFMHLAILKSLYCLVRLCLMKLAEISLLQGII